MRLNLFVLFVLGLPGHAPLAATSVGPKVQKNAQENVQNSLTQTSKKLCSRANSQQKNEFRYCWQMPQTTAVGREYSADNTAAPLLRFPNSTEANLRLSALPDDVTLAALYLNFGIKLSNAEVPWTSDQASALRDVLGTLPVKRAKPTTWILTNEYLPDDIEIRQHKAVQQVRIARVALDNARRRLVTQGERPGWYYSHRLFRAVVRYITDMGQDRETVSSILKDRFGLSIDIPNYLALTGEDSARFQAFHPSELLEFISILEEMPAAMRNLPGFRYLVRRRDGHCHPSRGCEVPAIAWTGKGYVEFLESAFEVSSIEYIHRLILHEKAHFLWDLVLTESLQADWIKLGGWYACANRPDQWCSDKQGEFVTAYAHTKNPDEDMAESLAYYVTNPDKLRSRSPDRYNWMRDNIMGGTTYSSKLREDLAFEVTNPRPDAVYPGKIKAVEVTVSGAPNQDKIITVELGLQADSLLEGASSARARLTSEAGTYIDLKLVPVDDGENGTRLRGQYTLSRFAKSGAWQTSSIVLSDGNGNQRMVGNSHFGWKMLVTNPLEDIKSPVYVPGSAQLSLSQKTVQEEVVDVITAQWAIEERNISDKNPCFAALNDAFLSSYSLERYGRTEGSLCQVEFVMPYYMPAGSYQLGYLKMFDQAGNASRVSFNSSGRRAVGGDETAPQIYLQTSIPDLHPPELDLNHISGTAQPVNPKVPDGESRVAVTFRVRDDISGYQLGSFRLRSPQGVESNHYHYPKGRSKLLPGSDELDWTGHQATVILPAGSEAGTWGVTEMTLRDRAQNFKTYSFTEIVTIELMVR